MTFATPTAYLGSTGLLGALTSVQDDSRLLEWMPDGLSPFSLAVVPTLITFASGWKTAHTPRADEPAPSSR